MRSRQFLENLMSLRLSGYFSQRKKEKGRSLFKERPSGQHPASEILRTVEVYLLP
jgi:hypothetical protein